MSRAFVKEPDGDQAGEDAPERPQSENPNYITADGYQKLQSRCSSLRKRVRQLNADKESLAVRTELQALQSELRYLEKREQCAIPVEPGSQAGDSIRFGATVQLLDENDERQTFTIVGEDEVDVEAGRISWTSPLGRALLEKRPGDGVLWQRPVGDLELEVVSVVYR